MPLAIRWRVRLLQRRLLDLLSRTRFACGQSNVLGYDFVGARYELPLRCYPGQQARFEGKRHNLTLALAAIDGVLVRPGEVLSFWHCLGRPTRRAGYREAAALKHGLLVEETGGAICLASTVAYNAGLLAGLTPLERYCHSVDTYGANRYFELGRDAAVEFPYRDLRLRNDLTVAVLIRAALRDDVAQVEARFERDPCVSVHLIVSAPVNEDLGLRVHTERVVYRHGVIVRDDLGWSCYERPRYHG